MKRVSNVKNEVPPSSFYTAELPTMPPPVGVVGVMAGYVPFIMIGKQEAFV